MASRASCTATSSRAVCQSGLEPRTHGLSLDLLLTFGSHVRTDILLDEYLRASLADTGFAKAVKVQGAGGGGATTTLMATTTGIGGLTPGFADPLIMTLGKMTPMTDG